MNCTVFLKQDKLHIKNTRFIKHILINITHHSELRIKPKTGKSICWHPQNSPHLKYSFYKAYSDKHDPSFKVKNSTKSWQKQPAVIPKILQCAPVWPIGCAYSQCHSPIHPIHDSQVVLQTDSTEIYIKTRNLTTWNLWGVENSMKNSFIHFYYENCW